MIPSRDPWQRRTIMLEADLRCVHCRYNLRGLAVSGRCPECGRAVWDSLLKGDLPAFYRSTAIAALLCMLLAAVPLLVAATLALGTSAGGASALVVTLLLASIALAGAGLGWFAVPLPDLRPADATLAVLAGVTFLAIAAVIASPLLVRFLPAVHAPWGPRAWDAAIAIVCAQLALGMRPAARLVFLLNHELLARLVQLAQIACLLTAAVFLASLAVDLTVDDPWLRPIALQLGPIICMGVVLVMTAAALSCRAAGPAHV